MGRHKDGSPASEPWERTGEAIILSAGAAELPAAFEEQLLEGGRLVIPLSGGFDDVYVYKKIEGNLVRQRLLTPARFVPLVREDR